MDGVVDLSGLGLTNIQRDGSSLSVGSMTTLTDLIEHPLCAALAGGILPDTARFEGPLNLRNAATVGGLVALAEPDSELYAALLALNASVVAVDREGVESVWQLDEFSTSQPRFARPPMLITEIRLPLGQAANGHARIARTQWIVVSSPQLLSPPSTAHLPHLPSQSENTVILCVPPFAAWARVLS